MWTIFSGCTRRRTWSRRNGCSAQIAAAMVPCTRLMNRKLRGPQPLGCLRALSAVERGSGLKAPKGHDPEEWFIGSFFGLITMHSVLEPATVRTAAFRLLPCTLRGRAVKRPEGHRPGDKFMGRHSCSCECPTGQFFPIESRWNGVGEGTDSSTRGRVRSRSFLNRSGLIESYSNLQAEGRL